MKNIFIHIEVQDGTRRHDHRVLHQTNCKNIDFAVEWYVAHFWGQSERDGDWWWYEDFAGRLVSYGVVSDEHFTILNKYL